MREVVSKVHARSSQNISLECPPIFFQCMSTRCGRMCLVACEGRKQKIIAHLGGLGGLLLRGFGTLAGGGVQNANVGAVRERVLRGSVYGRHLCLRDTYVVDALITTPQPPNATVLR